MAKRMGQEAKAQMTNDSAMAIISRDKAATDAKTARLRALREAQPPVEALPPTRKTARKKAIPVSKLNAENDG